MLYIIFLTLDYLFFYAIRDTNLFCLLTPEIYFFIFSLLHTVYYILYTDHPTIIFSSGYLIISGSRF